MRIGVDHLAASERVDCEEIKDIAMYGGGESLRAGFFWETGRPGMSLSEAAQQEQAPYTGKTRCCTGHRVPGYGLSLDRVPVS